MSKNNPTKETELEQLNREVARQLPRFFKTAISKGVYPRNTKRIDFDNVRLHKTWFQFLGDREKALYELQTVGVFDVATLEKIKRYPASGHGMIPTPKQPTERELLIEAMNQDFERLLMIDHLQELLESDAEFAKAQGANVRREIERLRLEAA